MTQEEKDHEIAAALDAAIEYEDAPPRRRPTIRRIGRIGRIRKDQKGQAMLDKGLLEQLGKEFATLAETEDRIRDLCRQIAGDGESQTGSAEKPLGPGTARTRRAQAATKEAKAKLGRGPKCPKDPGQIDQPWKKVTCADCGAVTGSRLLNDVRYPVGHYKPGTQIICPGRGRPAIAKEAGNEG